jgi:hypothetical protein
MSQLSDWNRARMCTENHVCTVKLDGGMCAETDQWGLRTRVCDARGGLPGGGGGEAEAEAGWRKLVEDLPLLFFNQKVVT